MKISYYNVGFTKLAMQLAKVWGGTIFSLMFYLMFLSNAIKLKVEKKKFNQRFISTIFLFMFS